MAAVVDEELSEQLEAAPFYSILIDKSTDIATDHTLIMYVRYVHGGEVCMRFFEITELSSGTANAKQAADSIPYIKKYINTIFKYYHYSPKHWSKLKEMQPILQHAEIKLKQTFHTRWLSFEGAVEAILANVDPLIAALIESDPTAKGILSFISTFQFLATTHFLADVLVLLSRLSKTF